MIRQGTGRRQQILRSDDIKVSHRQRWKSGDRLKVVGDDCVNGQGLKEVVELEDKEIRVSRRITNDGGVAMAGLLSSVLRVRGSG